MFEFLDFGWRFTRHMKNFSLHSFGQQLYETLCPIFTPVHVQLTLSLLFSSFGVVSISRRAIETAGRWGIRVFLETCRVFIRCKYEEALLSELILSTFVDITWKLIILPIRQFIILQCSSSIWISSNETVRELLIKQGKDDFFNFFVKLDKSSLKGIWGT